MPPSASPRYPPPTIPWIAKKSTLDSLRNRSVFLGNPDRNGFSNFLSQFKRREIRKGTRIISQGDNARAVYVIETGRCEVIVQTSRPCVTSDGVIAASKTRKCAGVCDSAEHRDEEDDGDGCIHVRRTLLDFDTFGEYSTVYAQPQAASVVAKSDVVVWEVSEAGLDEFIRLNPDLQHSFDRKRRIRRAISRVHWFLGSVDDETKMSELTDACSVKNVNSGDIIVEQGKQDEGNFYIVQEGEMDVLVSKDGRPPAFVAALGPGDSFGELALLNRDSRRNATVRASKDSVLLTITKPQFHRLARASCNALWTRFESCASVVQDGEKFMTMTDLGKALGSSSTGHSRAIELVFQAADQNQNHLVSWSEFVLLTGFLHRSDAELQLAFLFCDVNGDGLISRDEFRQAMVSMVKHQKGLENAASVKLPLDSREVNDLFGDSGSLSYSEFMDQSRKEKLAAVINMWEQVIAEVQASSEDLMISAMDTGEFIVMPAPRKPDTGALALVYLACGGTAGAISRLAVAPLIRVKMMMQTQTNKDVTGIWQGLRLMYSRDGWRGGFKGAGTNTVRIIPTTALQFLFFESFKNAVGKDRDLTVPERLLAGGFAGIGAAILTYPLDFIRARLTIQSSESPKYRGIVHGLVTVTQQEGPRALFRGLWPTCLGVFPYIGIDFAIYETLKLFLPYEPGTDHRAIPGLLACGGVAGLVSQTVAFPLELVRRRLQTQGFRGANYGYTGGVYHALKTTVHREGVAGLYRGLTANYLKAVPSIGISFVVYERMKSWLVPFVIDAG